MEVDENNILSQEALGDLLNSDQEEDVKLGIEIFNNHFYGKHLDLTILRYKIKKPYYISKGNEKSKWRNTVSIYFVRYFSEPLSNPFADPTINTYLLYLI